MPPENPPVPDDLDLTVDLNNQGGAQPYHGDAVGEHRQSSAPVQERVPEGPEPSLRDVLSNAFKGEGQQGDQGQQGGVPPAEAAKPEPSVAPELVKVGERWHNKDGTFASKEQIDAFNAAQQGQAAPVVNPSFFQHLTPVEQQQFTALPAEIRQFVERTMEGVNERAARYGEYDILEQHIIGPRRQAWAQGGMNPAAALNNLLSLSDFAGRDPGQFLLWFADQHRLDVDALLDARDAAAANQPPADPRLDGLVQEIAQLRNAFNGFSTATGDRDVQANLAIVQSFMDEKDANGQPKYPYFSDVGNDLSQYITNLKASQPYLSPYDTLKAAYEFACFNNPVVRGKVQAAEQAKVVAQRAQEAERARVAGSSINGGPAGANGSAPNTSDRTLREELEYNLQQATA